MRALRDLADVRGGTPMSVELNPDQRAAAECLDRPVFVTAGAGSGKTRMLTQRFLNAMVPGAVAGWRPAALDEILAITFTDKAAGEIAERVRLALRMADRVDEARTVSAAWISTIHGLCTRLLRRFAFDVGIDPLFTVGDVLRVGQLRERAFEAAARAVLADSGDGVRLFDAFDYSALFSATVAVARELAVVGMSADDIELESAESTTKLLGEARELFQQGMTTCDLGYAGSSSDPWDHAGRCEQLLGRCSALASVGQAESEVLSELLEVLDAYRPLRRLKGFEEVTDDLLAVRQDLVGRAAAALTVPHARALKRVVREYCGAYAASKDSVGVLDFDDLQIKAVALLEQRPDIAERYRTLFRVVMVDEFQDTDALQLRLVEALSDGDLCTVGDEMQSIYRFRGADVGVYRAHRQRMEKAGALVAELDVNYRSHPDILGFVNSVFASTEYFGGSLLRLEAPRGRGAGDLDATLGLAPRVETLFVDSTDVDGGRGRAAEAACIARRLAELCDAGVRPRDVAVLVRTYTHAHSYAEALSNAGLPAVVIGGSRFFGLPEIAVMRALNRAIANVEDGVALGALVASDFVPMTSDALAILRLGSGDRDSRSLWTLLRENTWMLAAADREAADRLASVLERACARVGRIPLADVLLLAVEEAGWDLRLLAGGNVGRDAFANVLKFARQATAFEMSAGAGPAGFAQHLDSKERFGETEAPASLADDGSDAVRIMSIHASKGLEFPIVAVPGLAAQGKNDSLSVRTARQGSGLAIAVKTPPGVDGAVRSASSWFTRFSEDDARADAEESARVLYVACTRAKEMLLVSGSMGLRPARGTKANNDLVRLSRILGVTIPIEGPSDTVVRLGHPVVPCRVRVVDAADDANMKCAASASEHEGMVLPPPAGPVLEESPRAIAPERLSYTQLSEFEHCPRRFWVRRVAGVRSARIPEPGAVDPLRFGTALHAGLRLVGPGGDPPSLERLEAIARFFELDRSGALRLDRSVDRYCASETARRVVAEQTVRRESPFSMRIGGRFLLTGSIDLYARTGDRAFVVDYKSGETGHFGELKERYALQAECYALAVLRDGCASVTVEFVRPEVEVPNGGMQCARFEFSDSDAERIDAELMLRYADIESSSFDPSPSNGCLHCDVPAGLCPERERTS
jgi:ATP-dependent helicase/nuclease subunit A